MEEATLRAKIQAMKNLLEIKQKTRGSNSIASSIYTYKQPHYGHYQLKNSAQSAAVHRSWNRYLPPVANSVDRSNVCGNNTNKVWRSSDAPSASIVLPRMSTLKMQTKKKPWKKPVKVMVNKRKSMQLQMLRLEDGEYSKANGGFSLVRAGVEKPTVVKHFDKAAYPVPVSRLNSNFVHIGGVKYVVANGGKTLKRCLAEGHATTASSKPGSMTLATKSGAARAAIYRAKSTMRHARSKHLNATRKSVKTRTMNCSFYDRFGFCKNMNACRFIHDSRRVAMCRKFLKKECSDPECLLSHQHDENKVPDCKMFLRGACTRESCKYRHVKVSVTAEVCELFTKGYYPKGDACQLRHELPLTSRRAFTTATVGQTSSTTPVTDTGTLLLPRSASSSSMNAFDGLSGLESPPEDKTKLSICPNFPFASRHSVGFPSLFDGLRRMSK